MKRRNRAKPLLLVGVLAGMAFGAVACSSPPPTPVSQPVRSATPSALLPLTGEPVSDDVAKRSVLVAKVDDTPPGRPQVGIDKADLIVQEPVEGGDTRLAAFFQSQSPKKVGPMRSVRTSDIGIVEPVLGALVASGGSQIALRALSKAGIEVISEGAPGFSRDYGRSAPYNLYVNLGTVRAKNPGKTPPQPYLQFGTQALPVGKKATKVTISYSDSASEQFRYDAAVGKWKRSGSGGAFAATTVLIVGVQLEDAGYKDPIGNPVPEVVTTGSGQGFLLNGPQVRAIRWSKDFPTSPWEITTDAGMAVSIPPGKSWIGLLPMKGGHVKFS